MLLEFVVTMWKVPFQNSPKENVSFWRSVIGNRVFSLATLIGVCMALLAGAVAYQVRSQVIDAFAELRETREFEMATNRALGAVVDIETGYRGMLITSDPRVHDPFVQGRKRLNDVLDHLGKLVEQEENFAPLTARFIAAARGAESALVEAAAQHEARPTQSKDAEDLLSTKGKVDALREVHGEFQNAIQAQLVARRASIGSILSTLVGAIVLLVVGIIFISFAQARELISQMSNTMRIRSDSEAEIALISQDLDASRSELQDVARKLALALRSAHVKVFSIDREGYIHWASETQIGLLAGRQLPAKLTDIASVNERPVVELRLKEIFEAGETTDFEMQIGKNRDSARWVRITIAPDDFGGAGLCLGSAVDITDLKRREESNFLLMRELSHRSKNLLAITQAMARQTARGAISISEFEKRFTARLRGLAAAHDLMVNNSYTGAALDQVIRSQVAVVSPTIGQQVQLEGPAIRLRPEAVQNLAMAFHELAANAERYGALSTPDGRVMVEWGVQEQDDHEQLVIRWQETGGPTVTQPEKKGFGYALIAQNLPRALMGDVVLSFPPEGATCDIHLKMSNVVSANADADA